MNILKIDTSDNLKTKVELVLDSQNTILEVVRKAPGDQNVLELLEKILQDKNIKLDKIDEIHVNTGPGSFTGLRVGVSIANALSFGLHISVNGKPLGSIDVPGY